MSGNIGGIQRYVSRSPTKEPQPATYHDQVLPRENLPAKLGSSEDPSQSIEFEVRGRAWIKFRGWNTSTSVSESSPSQRFIFFSSTSFDSYKCNETPAQRWLITPGSGKITLAGTPFCLDAGASACRHLDPFRFFSSSTIIRTLEWHPGEYFDMQLWQLFGTDMGVHQ